MSSMFVEAKSPESAEAIRLLVGAFRDVCGTAPNYLAITLADDASNETWKCIIQRPGGLAPDEKAALLAARLTELQQILDDSGCLNHPDGCDRCVVCRMNAAINAPMKSA